MQTKNETQKPSTTTEKLVRIKRKDSWANHDNVFFSLGSTSLIRYIELGQPIRPNTQDGSSHYTSISDMIICGYNMNQLKKDIQQLPAFENLYSENPLILDAEKKILRIKLSYFITSPSSDSYQLDVPDGIYDLLNKHYDCDVYKLANQFRFPLLTTLDQSWPLAFCETSRISKSRRPFTIEDQNVNATQIQKLSTSHAITTAVKDLGTWLAPTLNELKVERQNQISSENRDILLQPAELHPKQTLKKNKSYAVNDIVEALQILKRPRVLSPPAPPCVETAPQKLSLIPPIELLKVSTNRHTHFTKPPLFSDSFCLKSTTGSSGLFYDALIDSIDPPNRDASKTVIQQTLVQHIREQEQHFKEQINNLASSEETYELKSLVSYHTWLQNIQDKMSQKRCIPSLEISTLAKLLKCTIIMVTEQAAMHPYPCPQAPCLFILFNVKDATYHALNVLPHAEKEIMHRLDNHPPIPTSPSLKK